MLLGETDNDSMPSHQHRMANATHNRSHSLHPSSRHFDVVAPALSFVSFVIRLARAGRIASAGLIPCKAACPQLLPGCRQAAGSHGAVAVPCAGSALGAPHGRLRVVRAVKQA